MLTVCNRLSTCIGIVKPDESVNDVPKEWKILFRVWNVPGGGNRALTQMDLDMFNVSPFSEHRFNLRRGGSRTQLVNESMTRELVVANSHSQRRTVYVRVCGTRRRV